MCVKCVRAERARVREKLRRLLVGMLVLIFFCLMAYDLLGYDEPTDTNVELANPPELECNDPHGYYCSEPRPTYF